MAELTKVRTPVGKLIWVQVTGPGKLNMNEDGREYVASIILPNSKCVELKNSIIEVYNTNTVTSRTCKSLGFRPCNEAGNGTYDKDGTKQKYTEAETEYTVFSFKTNATFKDGNPKVISIYNSEAAKVDIGNILIGNDTVGAISGNLVYYTYGKSTDGVSLYLNAIQIIKLVEYTENPGFEAEGSGEDRFISPGENQFTGVPLTPQAEQKPQAEHKPTKPSTTTPYL